MTEDMKIVVVTVSAVEAARMDLLICTRCGGTWERPKKFARSNFVQFICNDCRCKECGIVLGLICTCGDVHGQPSPTDSQVCVECQIIREYVLKLDEELLDLRAAQIAEEQMSDPIRSSKRKIIVN